MTIGSQRPATIPQCAILAGGLGTRLGDITAHIPKPVLDVAGRPFIAWLMREMLRFGVEEFIILTGHLSASVVDAVQRAAEALPKAVSVVFSEEPIRAGTGGALLHARKHLSEKFLLCNGDSLFDCNIAALLAACARDGPDILGRLIVRQIPDAGRYGTVNLDGDRVAAFSERPEGADAAGKPGIINAGIYALDGRVFNLLTEACSLERDLLPKLAEAGQLRATRLDGWFVDIGIPADLARARREMPSSLNRPALFLDGESLFRRRPGAVAQPDWVNGARETMAHATQHGWHVFVIMEEIKSIGGRDGKTELEFILNSAADELRRTNVTIEDWRCCSAGATMSVTIDLLQAWALDPHRCVFIGTRHTDIQAASVANLRGALFPGDDLLKFAQPLLDIV